MNAKERCTLSVPAGETDLYVRERMVMMLSRPGVVAEMAKAVRSNAGDLAKLAEKERAYTRELEEIQAQREALEITHSEYINSRRPVVAELDRIGRILAGAQRRTPVSVLLGKNVEREWPKLTLAQERAILDQVVTITILPNPVKHAQTPAEERVRIELTDEARAVIGDEQAAS